MHNPNQQKQIYTFRAPSCSLPDPQRSRPLGGGPGQNSNPNPNPRRNPNLNPCCALVLNSKPG
eukprot:1380658-Amorphochlora_amoeboformis.AAC.1